MVQINLQKTQINMKYCVLETSELKYVCAFGPSKNLRMFVLTLCLPATFKSMPFTESLNL